ncbi:MAG: beta-ketoacyl synthase chain length factor [Burkholderiaceae bacterium]
MNPIRVDVLAVGILGPGIGSWPQLVELLRAGHGFVDAATVLPVPMRLPTAERRRAGAAIKVAMAVADEAVAAAGVDPQFIATVFTASNGEGANCHNLCETLASSDRSVSPTRFTNSVHNAAAGYWHIAVASRAASTSLCGFDTSFGAGLLEAIAQVATTNEPVLLIATDTPYPEPLHAKRIVRDNFGLALVLTPPGARGALAHLQCSLHSAPHEGPAAACRDSYLEGLRSSLPAAAGLALLEALTQVTAARPERRIVLACPPALQLHVDLTPP